MVVTPTRRVGDHGTADAAYGRTSQRTAARASRRAADERARQGTDAGTGGETLLSGRASRK